MGEGGWGESERRREQETRRERAAERGGREEERVRDRGSRSARERERGRNGGDDRRRKETRYDGASDGISLTRCPALTASFQRVISLTWSPEPSGLSTRVT